MRAIIVLACFARALLAQQTPDGDLLMKQAEIDTAAYRSMQFVLDRTLEFTAADKRKKLTDRVVITFATPDKLRIETRGQTGNRLVVSNGEMTWWYDLDAKVYLKMHMAMDLAAPVAALGIPALPGAASLSMAAHAVDQETIEIDGQRHDCWVVQNAADEFTTAGSGLIRDPVWTVWIDKKRGLDLRSTLSGGFESEGVLAHLEMKATKRALRLNVPIADSKFIFEPPGRASEGSLSSLRETLFYADTLRGNKAPAIEIFGLPKPDGKPVLLAFGSTWSRPWRDSLPVLERNSTGSIRIKGFSFSTSILGMIGLHLNRCSRVYQYRFPLPVSAMV